MFSGPILAVISTPYLPALFMYIIIPVMFHYMRYGSDKHNAYVLVLVRQFWFMFYFEPLMILDFFKFAKGLECFKGHTDNVICHLRKLPP